MVYEWVQLTLRCGKSVCERLERGITQAKVRTIILNMLDKEEEKEEVLGLMILNGVRDWKS